MIRVENVGKTYKKKEALSEVSFEIHANEIIALVGPNGAGKSTLLRILSDVSKPSFGKVIKDGALKMGTVFDYNGLYLKMTAYENLSFFYRLNLENSLDKEEELIEYNLNKMGLLRDANRQVRGFSKGMARKLAISRALLTNPDILILDEPFDGIDIQSHAFLKQFLKDWLKNGEDKKAVVFSSHNMADVEDLCDRMLLIKKGHLKKNLSMIDFKDRMTSQYKISFFLEEDTQRAEGALKAGQIQVKSGSQERSLIVNGEIRDMNAALRILVDQGIIIMEASPVFDRLEDVYIAEMGDAE